MNVEGMRFFLENQLDAIQNGGSEDELILIMANQLLEQLGKSSEAENADDKQVRLMIRQCAKLTRYTKEFVDSFGGNVASSAAALQKVADNDAAIAARERDCNTIEESKRKIDEQEKELREKNKELFSKERELRDRENEYNGLVKKLDDYKKIIETVTDDLLESLRNDISRIKDDAEEKKKRRDLLEAKRNTAKTKLKDTEIRISRLNSEIEKINKEIAENTDEAERLDAICSNAVGDAERLAKKLVEANEQFEELRAVIEQNDKISEQIRINGFVVNDSNAENNFYSYVEVIRERADEVINDYNRLLENVINDSMELYKKIMERQNPKV